MAGKKDPNYVAKLEKAIAEKYGKDTVQDFRGAWDDEKEREYLQQLKEKNTQVSQWKKNKKEQKQNRNCPVCKTYSFSAQDDLYMVRYKCCRQCYVEFICQSATFEQKWQAGWRPTADEVEQRIILRRKNNG